MTTVIGTRVFALDVLEALTSILEQQLRGLQGRALGKKDTECRVDGSGVGQVTGCVFG